MGLKILEENMSEIYFKDIVSKPVGMSYEFVQTLGIYCWQSDEKERNAGFFLPRLSYNKNKEYITALYPDLEQNTDLQGRGIYTSIWRIGNYYNSLSLENAERILCRDIATLAAFKAWMELVPNSKSEKPLTEHTLMQMYVLEEEKRFAQFKYTATKNSFGTIYYDWKEILVREREIKGKE